mmetsp:Transcript_24667/g.72152  ORF Transcript_24667/g.72152 Transcript_24667/m.72152 type:complete len:542 (-) Transcript_24667:141-1766(-)
MVDHDIMMEEVADHDVSPRRTPALSIGNISFIFYLLGIGSLLPWNAFINANEYFQSRLCSESSPNEGGLVELWFGLIFNVTGALTLGVFLAVDRYKEKRESSGNATAADQVVSEEDQTELERNGGQVMDNSKRNDSHSRQMVYSSLSLYLVVFLLTTVMVLVPSVQRSTFLTLTLSGIGVCGASMAITGTGVTAVAAMFPPSIGISSYFSGQATGGVVVAIANVIVAFAESPDKFHDEHCSRHSKEDGQIGHCPVYETDLASLSYFSVGCLFLVACLVGFHQLDRHIRISNSTLTQGIEESIPEESVESNAGREQFGTEIVLDVDFNADLSIDLQQPLLGGEDSMERGAGPSSVNERSTSAVWRAIFLPVLSIFITLFIVIIITPSWVVNIESTGRCAGGRLQNDLFVPILFVVFNSGDLVGRVIAGKLGPEKIKHLPKKLFAFSVSRILFLPLFLLCPAPNSVIPVIINSDAYTILLLFLFALSNGFSINMSFMLFPRLLPDDEYLHEIGSTIMNFSLALGLFCGSFLSFSYVSFATPQH